MISSAVILGFYKDLGRYLIPASIHLYNSSVPTVGFLSVQYVVLFCLNTQRNHNEVHMLLSSLPLFTTPLQLPHFCFPFPVPFAQSGCFMFVGLFFQKNTLVAQTPLDYPSQHFLLFLDNALHHPSLFHPRIATVAHLFIYSILIKLFA